MLTEYINAAIHKASYEALPEDNCIYGEIPDFQGVWATGTSLEDCALELKEVLEGWIIVGLREKHILPVVDGIDLNVYEGVA